MARGAAGRGLGDGWRLTLGAEILGDSLLLGLVDWVT